MCACVLCAGLEPKLLIILHKPSFPPSGNVECKILSPLDMFPLKSQLSCPFKYPFYQKDHSSQSIFFRKLFYATNQKPSFKKNKRSDFNSENDALSLCLRGRNKTGSDTSDLGNCEPEQILKAAMT